VNINGESATATIRNKQQLVGWRVQQLECADVRMTLLAVVARLLYIIGDWSENMCVKQSMLIVRAQRDVISCAGLFNQRRLCFVALYVNFKNCRTVKKKS
jgi:hypothetical protein